MSKQISVDDLALGMYLVGIDKPWLETPFLRHQFKISSDAQIQKLRATGVKIVTIDVSRGTDIPDKPPVSAASMPMPDVEASTPLRSPGLQPKPIDARSANADPPAKKESSPYAPQPAADVRPPVIDDSTRRVFDTDSPEGSEEFRSLLRVKMILQLSLPFQKRQALCTTRLFGWCERQFLLTDLPFQDGRAIEFRPGILCVARFVESGRIFGFRTETIKGQFSPVPLLFLRFPHEVEELSLRRSPRVPVTLKTIVRIQNLPDTRLAGIVRDISLAGCRLELTGPDQPAVTGANIALSLQLPGISDNAILPGVVRNVTVKPSRGEPYLTKVLLGIEFQFEPADPTAPASVEQFVKEQLELVPV